MEQVLIEIFLTFVSLLQIYRSNLPLYETSAIVSNRCLEIRESSLSEEEVHQIDIVYQMLSTENQGSLSFKLVVSVLVVLYGLNALFMLKRTDTLGSVIIMVGHMIDQLIKFTITFSLMLLLLLIGLSLLSPQLTVSG